MHTQGKANGADRRRHKRVSVSPKILKGSEFKAIDLSEGGMKVETGKAYPRSKAISLTLNLNGELLELQAKVMRCQQTSSVFSSNYLLGVMFVNISASEFLKIREYLEPTRQVEQTILSA